MANNIENDTFIIRYCKVESVEDDAKGCRLKVRIPVYDPTFVEDPLMDKIPFCFPLLPKLIHVYPKVGEMVFVVLQQQGSTQGDRFFIGPVVSQDYYLRYCNEINANTLLQGEKIFPPSENPDMNPDNNGTIPDREDIAIRGRSNSDIIFLEDELRLRCGFKKYPGSTSEENTLNFNEHDMSYIQMKYFPNGKTDSLGEYNSVVNIVGDRVNIMSYDGKPGAANADWGGLITEEEQDNIQHSMHQLPYGDDLVEYLRKVIDIFSNHSHSWHKKTPDLVQSEIDVLNTDLTQFVSKTIRIN